MADLRGSNHNPHSRKAMTHRRRRAVGLTGAISAFLALGLVPLANAPKATADEFDVVIDQVFNAITPSLGDVAAGSAAAASPVDVWLHGLEQDWISSGVGQQVDTTINSWFNLADPSSSACGLICDGADGQGGGLIFGEAGNAAVPMSEN